MPKDLLNFLATLATDVDQFEAYIRDPEAAMRLAGLSESDIGLATSGDVRALESQIGPGTAPVKHYYYWEDWTVSRNMSSDPSAISPVRAGSGVSATSAPVLCVPVPYQIGEASYVAFVPVQSLPEALAGPGRTEPGRGNFPSEPSANVAIRAGHRSSAPPDRPEPYAGE